MYHNNDTVTSRHLNSGSVESVNREIIFLLLGVSLLLSCGVENRADAKSGQKLLTVVQSSDILTLDPYTMNETVTQSVLHNIMEPLIKLDRDLKIDVESCLAEGWRNPDDYTWIFNIRPGVRFHNGKGLTADDVKASIERAMFHPLTDFGGGLGNIASISAENNNTLLIKMKEPNVILPYILSLCMIISREQAELWHNDELTEKPIGTGPYRLTAWKKGKSVQLEAFDDYWKGKPSFQRVFFIPESNPRKRIDKILERNADLVVDIPVDMVDDVKERNDVELITQESLRVIYLGFDMARDKSPYINKVPNPLKKIEVRQAIYLAIDEEKIIKDVLRGYGKPASQFCSPYVFGFNPRLERPPYDPERAKKLLVEAGYPDGFTITLHCPNNRYVKDEEIGAAVAEQLEEVGIKVVVNAMSKEEFFPGFTEGNYSFFLVGWDCAMGDASSVFIHCLHTKDQPDYGFFNAGNYSNAKLDSIIELIEVTLDPIKRMQLFESAQELGMRDLPWVPLHTQVNIYGSRRGVPFEPRLDKQIPLFELSPLRYITRLIEKEVNR